MNKDKLHEELTEMHIRAMYDFIYPIDYSPVHPTPTSIRCRKNNAFDMYRYDNVFNARIKQLVCETISIVDDYAKPEPSQCVKKASVEDVIKPPVGLTPKMIWRQRRRQDIVDAMKRYADVGKVIPSEWIQQLADLQ